MNRVALFVLAAVAGGTGCVVTTHSDQPGTIGMGWTFTNSQSQVYGNGTAQNPGCAEAGVNQVAVTITDPNGRQVLSQAVDCQDASTQIPGVAFTISSIFDGESYGWSLDALRGDTVVYHAEGSTVLWVGDMVDVGTVALDAIYQDIALSFTVPSCSGISDLELALYEADNVFPNYPTSTLAFSSALGPNPNIGIVCKTAGVITLPSVPQNQWYEFHYISAVNSSGESVYQICNTTFDHQAQVGQTADVVAVHLATSTTQCP